MAYASKLLVGFPFPQGVVFLLTFNPELAHFGFVPKGMVALIGSKLAVLVGVN